jgi:hypothetical protein
VDEEDGEDEEMLMINHQTNQMKAISTTMPCATNYNVKNLL